MTEQHLTASEAMRQGVCRVCGKRSSEPMVFDHGNEYAHKQCVPPRPVEPKVATVKEGAGW